MSKYKSTNYGVVLREDGASIPMCDGNRDYDEYKIWVAEGNVPDPADPEPAQDNTPSIEERLSATEAALRDMMLRSE